MDAKYGIIENTGLHNADFHEKVEDLYQAIMDDNLNKVREIMDPIGCEYQMMILTLRAVPPVLAASEYNSLNCLKYFLELHERHKEHFKTVGEDQVDGFVTSEMDGKNAIHLLAMRPDGSEAASILEDHSELLKDIINRKDNSGATPLLTAVKRNNEGVAKYLVQNGAEIDKVINGQSPINVAVENGLLDVVKEMWKRAPNEERSQLVKNANLYGEGHSVLYPAACSRNDDMFRFLFEEMGRKAAGESLSLEIQHSDFPDFLKLISSSGMTFAMTKLMEEYDRPGSEVRLRIRTDHGTPLIWAVKGKQLELVKVILDNHLGKDTVEMEDEEGRNVFHYAAEVDRNILEYLMQEEYSHLFNKRDKRGCTPLHHAVVAGLRENVDLLWKCNLELNNESIFHCQFCIKNGSHDMMEYMLVKFQECTDEKTFSHFLESQSKKRRTPVHEAAFSGRTDILELLLKKFESFRASGDTRSTYLNWSALHFAVAGNSLPAVKFLVENFPYMVNWRSYDDKTPTVLAAENRYADILKFLLENGANVFGETSRENLFDCVTKYSRVHGGRETALEIIKHCCKDGDIDLLKKLMKNSKYGSEGVMCKLLKELPSVALEILNQCTKYSEKMDSVDSRTSTKTNTYHFFPIQNSTKKVGNELLALRTMIKYNRYDCLGHPVVEKLLDMKWNSSTTRMWYISNIILYATFVFSLTTYIVLHTKGIYRTMSPGLIILSMLSITVIALNVAKEIMQIMFGWKEYFFDINNYMEWGMYLSAGIYLIPLGKEKTKVQTQAGAVAIFLAWINFIWLFKRMSLFGIYIIMAKKVFTSLLKVLPMVTLFLFAFSMVFFLLLNDDEGYHNISTAMLTTSVMMAGEIDFRDVFLAKGKGPHYVLERLFLLCFLIVITIVIMNLLVGLAVGDTDETMKRSKAENRFYKASLIVALQRSMSHMPWIKVRNVEDPLIVDMKAEEKTKSWLIRLWDKVYSDNEADGVDETRVILSRLSKVESSVGKLEASINHMRSLLERINNYEEH